MKNTKILSCLFLTLTTCLFSTAHAQRISNQDLKFAKGTTWTDTMVANRNRYRDNHKMTERAGQAISQLSRLIEDAFPMEWDWFLQDTHMNFSAWFAADDSLPVLKSLLKSVKPEIKNPDLIRQIDQALGNDENQDERALLELYQTACLERRYNRIQSLSESAPQIVFTKHYNIGGSHYAYTEGQSDAQAERHFQPGSELCLLKVNNTQVSIRPLLTDQHGVIRDPDISWDGQRILFAWKKDDRQDDYHLYEYTLSNGQIRQLTDGLGVSDYEGCYLPDDNIIFNSTRCVQIVDCWWTEVSNLYTCDDNGRFLRRLGFDQVHTNFPTVTNKGQIIYTRWDYNDRGQIYPQPLFQMNQDGTGQMEFYGNNSWFPTTIIHARSIPDSPRLIAILTGHHSHQRGKLAIIDPSKGRQEAEGVQLIAPIRDTQAVKIDAYGQDGDQFQYPYPLSESEFLVTYCPYDMGNRQYTRSFGIYWMNIDGKRELLAYDPAISCNQPIPVKSRGRPIIRPSQVDYTKKTGTYYMQNIYAGPALNGITPGTVKKLRVITLDFRAAGIGQNGSSGPGGGALSSTPVSCRNGAWDVKIVLGETPVYEDGSACFEVPARTPVYFQAIDKNGHAIQTMRSWSTLQPGESLSCVGCHEHKNSTPPNYSGKTAAMLKGTQPLQHFYGEPRGFSYPKEIQPIWDKHCISCHNDSNQKFNAFARRKQPVPDAQGQTLSAFSLAGNDNLDPDSKRYWSDSYLALTQDGRMNRIVNWLEVQSIPAPIEPYYRGAAVSELIPLLANNHQGVHLNQEEMDKIACWIDLLVPYCGDYREANAWDDAEKQKYDHFLNKRQRLAEEEMKNIRDFLEFQTRMAQNH